MKPGRQQLIERLAMDLQPVRPVTPPTPVAVLWWLCTWVTVVGATLLYAPLRSGVLQQLAGNGRFALESLLGLIAAGIIAAFAFRDSIPGYARRTTQQIGLILAALWVLGYVIGLAYPTLAPSMAGKRAHCFAEVLIYAIPPTLAGMYLCRRNYVLAPVRTLALIALAAAMVPALFMQFACMYDAAHILKNHILPIPLVVAAAVSVYHVLRWWRVRSRN